MAVYRYKNSKIWWMDFIFDGFRVRHRQDLVGDLAVEDAREDVPLEDDERNAALRRALFVFAAGGALNRDPALDDPAVIELAGDLDSAERREALARAIERLDADAEALDRLRDPDIAWRAYACALLADALGEDEVEA